MLSADIHSLALHADRKGIQILIGRFSPGVAPPMKCPAFSFIQTVVSQDAPGSVVLPSSIGHTRSRKPGHTTAMAFLQFLPVAGDLAIEVSIQGMLPFHLLPLFLCVVVAIFIQKIPLVNKGFDTGWLGFHAVIHDQALITDICCRNVPFFAAPGKVLTNDYFFSRLSVAAPETAVKGYIPFQ